MSAATGKSRDTEYEDGTKVKFGPDQNVPLIYAWLDALRDQTVMEGAA